MNILMLISSIVSLFIWTGLTGCSHMNKNKNQTQTSEASEDAKLGLPPIIDGKFGTQITRFGSTARARWNRDQSQIFYITERRDSHRNTELYSYSMPNKKEARWTFQDGIISDVLPLSLEVLYTSTTEEMKERPFLLYPELRNVIWPLNDLFRADQHGSNIQRLTKDPGFIGHLNWVEADKTLVFASQKGANLVIQEMSLDKSVRNSGNPISRKTIASHIGKNLSYPLRWTKKALIYVEQDQKNEKGNEKLFLQQGNKSHPLPLEAEKIYDLQWIEGQEGSLLLTRWMQGKSQILRLDLAQECTSVLLEDTQDLRSPDFSLSRGQLLFTRPVEKNWQVFVLTMDLKTKPCEPWRL